MTKPVADRKNRNPPIPYSDSHLLLLLVIVNLHLAAVQAAPGDLDPTLAWTGRVRTGFGGGPGIARAAAVQNDGKLVLAGFSQRTTTNSEFAIERFDTNNVLDASFGGDGRITTALGSHDNAAANALRIQADGKPVAAGYAYDGTNDTPVFALVRYNPDGSLDTSFGNGGRSLPIC